MFLRSSRIIPRECIQLISYGEKCLFLRCATLVNPTTRTRPMSVENRQNCDRIKNENDDKRCKTGTDSGNRIKKPVPSTINPAMEKKRQMVLMEIEVFRQSGELDLNPDELTERDWREILETGSPHQRKKYFKYISKRNVLKSATKVKREKKNSERIAHEKTMAEETAGHIQYGLAQNTLFYRIGRSAMSKVHNSRLAHAVFYGQKLVFDLGYNEHMRQKDIRSCVEQMKHSYGHNARDEDPFHLHLCNAHADEALLQQLQLAVPPLGQPKPLVTVTEKSYMDIFPKQKLIYLTPDCRNDLLVYDHDAIYIIGCFVDKMQSLPISLAKAKQEGLKMARLPLERYLRWSKGGNKSLTIDQMMNIMLTMKNTGDWAVALKHVPVRKLVQRSYIPAGPARQRGESLFGQLT